VRVRVQQLIFQAERINQIEQWFAGEETLRPQLEAKAVLLLCGDDAAWTVARFQYAHGNSGLLEAVGAGQA
jgi:hypothetical protein